MAYDNKTKYEILIQVDHKKNGFSFFVIIEIISKSQIEDKNLTSLWNRLQTKNVEK